MAWIYRGGVVPAAGRQFLHPRMAWIYWFLHPRMAWIYWHRYPRGFEVAGQRPALPAVGVSELAVAACLALAVDAEDVALDGAVATARQVVEAHADALDLGAVGQALRQQVADH